MALSSIEEHPLRTSIPGLLAHFSFSVGSACCFFSSVTWLMLGAHDVQKKNAYFGVLLWYSGLRIWYGHCSGSGCCCDVGLIPGLGTSACHGCRQNRCISLNQCSPPEPSAMTGMFCTCTMAVECLKCGRRDQVTEILV